MSAATYHLRNRSQFIKGGFFVAFAAFLVVATVIDGRGSLVPPVLIGLGVCLLAWVFYFHPSLRIDAEGLTAVNWFRHVRVPWAAYRGYKSRFGLVLAHDDGEYPVACFPGSGGLAKGRDQIQQERIKRDGMVGDKWLAASAGLQWANLRQTRWAIDSAAKKAGAHVGAVDRFDEAPKPVSPSAMRASHAFDPVALIIAGVGAGLVAAGLSSIL